MDPVHRFKELKDALGSAPLRRLRLNDFNKQTFNSSNDSDYDGDDEYNMLEETQDNSTTDSTELHIHSNTLDLYKL